MAEGASGWAGFPRILSTQRSTPRRWTESRVEPWVLHEHVKRFVIFSLVNREAISLMGMICFSDGFSGGYPASLRSLRRRTAIHSATFSITTIRSKAR